MQLLSDLPRFALNNNICICNELFLHSFVMKSDIFAREFMKSEKINKRTESKERKKKYKVIDTKNKTKTFHVSQLNYKILHLYIL